MQKYSAQSQGGASANFLCNLFANGAVPRVYYIQIGAVDGAIIPNMGMKFRIFRTSDSGTSNVTTNGQLLNASPDSLSSNSNTQLKTGFTVDPTVPGTAILSLSMFFRGMTEWTAKRGREISLGPSQGLAIQSVPTGMVVAPGFSFCFQFEE